MNVQQVQIAIDHKGFGTCAIDDLVSCNGDIRMKALFCRVGGQYIHHAPDKTRCAADFDTHSLDLFGGFCNARHQTGIATQAIQLHWNKILKHCVNIGLCRVRILDFAPSLANVRIFCQLRDMQVFP